MSAFRFDAKNAFLTYSRIGRDFDLVNTVLDAVVAMLRAHVPAVQLRFAIEAHDDGDDIDNPDWHIHVLAVFATRFCKRGDNVFDVTVNGKRYHPNISAPKGSKHLANQYKYLEKGGIFGGDLVINTGDDDAIVDDAPAFIMEAQDREEFWDRAKTHMGKQVLTCYNSFSAYAEKHYPDIPRAWTSRYTLDSFTNIPQLLSTYADMIISDADIGDRPKSLCVISPTRYGKTQWARAITPDHSYLATNYMLDSINQESRLVIFDDIDMLTIAAHYKFWFGMQEEANLTDKYRKKIRVLRGWRGFIYLCNDDPRNEKGIDTTWLNGNCYFIRLDNKLF
jgi:hypothetical protein